jgi:ribonuclease HI
MELKVTYEKHWAAELVAGDPLPAEAPQLLIYAVGSCLEVEGVGAWAFGTLNQHGMDMDRTGLNLSSDPATIAIEAVVAALKFAAGAPAIIVTDSKTVLDWARSAGLGRKRGRRARDFANPIQHALWIEFSNWFSAGQLVRRPAIVLHDDFAEIRERAEAVRREVQAWKDDRAVCQSCEVLRQT